MGLSACITINDRDVSVLDTVFDSMRAQTHDEFIIVLDRTPAPLADYCRRWWRDDERTRFVEVKGAQGWRSPVKAWNAGYAAVTGDLLYCFSSETVQAPGNVEKARAILASEPKSVVFGKAECSCGPWGQEVNWNGTAPGNLLCSAEHPRPLGFIWAAPMAPVREIGGWDEEFDRGLWYDETDFFFQLWRTGLDFIFADSIGGTHLHHERPVLATAEGAAATHLNAAYLLRKYGTLAPLAPSAIREVREAGRTVWKHV